MANRNMRRKMAKQDAATFRKAAYATDASIEKHMAEFEAEIREATQNNFMGLMYCVFILVLRKVCGYGPVRTLRAMQEVAAVINDLQEGRITVFDIKRDAEEAGIKTVFDVHYNIIECGIFEEDEYAAARKKVDDERMRLYREHPMDGLRLWTNPEFGK